MSHDLSSAAVVIGALRVKIVPNIHSEILSECQTILALSRSKLFAKADNKSCHMGENN